MWSCWDGNKAQRLWTRFSLSTDWWENKKKRKRVASFLFYSFASMRNCSSFSLRSIKNRQTARRVNASVSTFSFFRSLLPFVKIHLKWKEINLTRQNRKEILKNQKFCWFLSLEDSPLLMDAGHGHPPKPREKSKEISWGSLHTKSQTTANFSKMV